MGNDFEKASQNANAGFIRELWYFVRASKKWWLMPIIAMFLLFGALMLLSSTAAAPFIYTLF